MFRRNALLRYLIAFVGVFLAGPVFSQSDALSLSSRSAAPGSTVSLNLSLSSSAGNQPAGLQWTLTYPTDAISGVTLAGGPVLSAANKNLSCAPGNGSYTCVANGLNQSLISDGVVAIATMTVQKSADIGVVSTTGASASADTVAVTGTGGAVTTTGGTAGLNSLSCSPASLAAPANSACTVTLTGPAPVGGSRVAIKSSSRWLTVPSSVTIPSGSNSATFSATSGNPSISQSVTVTATLSKVSRTTTVTILPASAAAISALTCSPTSLVSGGTSTCTVTISPAAPTGGIAVSVSSNNSDLSVPALVTAVAGSATANFIASAGTVTASASAVVTASLNSSSKTATLSIAAGTVVDDSGLVGYWKLDEGSGAITADATANTNNGSFVGDIAWTTGKFGKALHFPGSSYVTVPSSTSLSVKGAAISFGAWYYHDTNSNGFLMGKTASDYTYMMGVDKAAQQFTAYLKTGGNLTTLRFPESMPGALSKYNNTWVHYFIVYDGASISAYVNGVKQASTAATGNVNSNSDPFAIGARGDGQWTRFTGTIDEARIYERALRADEVLSLSNGATGGVVSPPTISSFTASPSTVSSGASSTLSWSVANATSLSIDQGLGTVTGATSVPVSPTTATTYTLTASNSGGSTTARTTVTVTTATLALSSVSCSPSNLTTPGTSTCTVYLTAAAPSSGTTVALSSNNAKLSVPGSMVVPATCTSGTFTATAAAVTADASATVTASYGGVSKTTALSLKAAVTDNAGLVGYWALDDASGTTAGDSSGSGNTGTLVGNPVWTTGKTAGGLKLDGSDYVQVNSSPSLAIGGNAISFGAWYYHTSTASGFIMGKTVSNYSYMMGVDQGSQQFLVYLNTGNTLHTVRFPNSTPNGLSQYNNIWTHLFVVYDGSTIVVYLNGNQAVAEAATGNVLSNGDPFAIGARGGDGSWTRFNSTIDEVRVYNRALFPTEVQTLYGNAGGGTPPPPPATPSIASFSASPASVTAGQSSTLSWTASNATSLTIDQGVGDVTGKSSVSVTPSLTTAYTLIASNASGSATAKTTVTVTSTAPPPAGTITVNSSVTHQTMVGWEATAEAGQVECPNYNNYKSSLYDQAVNDFGINRLRVELRALSDGITFNMTLLDSTVNQLVLPMRQLLAGRGEKLFVNVCFVGASKLHSDPTRYAQQVLATYNHMQSTFGFVPDSWEVALEPTVVSPNWTPQAIGDAIVSSGGLLKSNGYTPYFIAPSTPGGADNAIPWFDQMVAHSPGVFPYLRELSYHRYGSTDTYLTQLAQRGQTHGIDTAMLEHIGSDYNDLHNDLKIANNAAWEQYTLAYCLSNDDGSMYYWAQGNSVSLGSRAKMLRQYFKYIRAGAVRIDAQSGNSALDPVAFRNTNGKFIVVVRATAGASFTVTGVPAGTYGIKYSTPSQYNMDLADVTIGSSGTVPASIPGAGVITIYGK